jgi:DNA-binding NtrC family response regulator
VGWEAHVAFNLRAAADLISALRPLVGVVLSPKADPTICAQIDGFLQAYSGMEWIGVFAPAALELPSYHDLIFERFFDHLTMPVEVERLAATLGHAYGRASLRRGQDSVIGNPSEMSIVGRAPEIVRLIRQIHRIAKVDAPALICGESGCGKELVAREIHSSSPRAKGAFVAVNCAAIPIELIQSELFGHEKGSFTGADRQTRGYIETADGGTLFLDEIGDLHLDAQKTLLRFLEEGTINRVGTTRVLNIDARVIAATHVDLEAAVAAGAFRKDLYYRLNVLPLSVPPLRDRSTDIKLLAEHFFEKFNAERSPKLKGFSRRAMMAMMANDWPGNVRELINRIRRATVLAEGRLIIPADLGLEELDKALIRVPLDEARMIAERRAISECLELSGKNVSSAAKQLCISRMTLYRLMAKHRISA